MNYIKLFEDYNNDDSIAEDAFELFLVDVIPNNVKVNFNNYYSRMVKRHLELSRISIGVDNLNNLPIDKLSDKLNQMKDYYKDQYDIKYTYIYTTDDTPNYKRSVVMDKTYTNSMINYKHMIIHFFSK